MKEGVFEIGREELTRKGSRQCQFRIFLGYQF